MWPWGHVAVGYLLYSAGCHTAGARPRGPAVLALTAGTLAPDLIDKPLAWTFGVLPAGRSLGHSVLVMGIALAVVAVAVAPRRRRRTVVPFAVGTGSHALADLGPDVLLGGEWSGATYLLWPLLPPPPSELAQSFLAHVAAFSLTPYAWVQIGLAGLAAGLWLADGRPGLETLRRPGPSRAPDEAD